MTLLTDHDRQKYLNPPLGDWPMAAVVFVVLFSLVATATGQNYDATGRDEQHAELGLYNENLQPMIVLYEKDLFAKHAPTPPWKHAAHNEQARSKPDGEAWKAKLDNHPTRDVLIDIESSSGDYQAYVVGELQAYDKGRNRKWYRYGMPYGPKSRLEGRLDEGITRAIKLRESKLMQLYDGWAVPCYKRWNYRYAERYKYVKFLCDLTGKDSIAIYWCEYHEANKEKGNQPIPATEIIRDLRMLKETYGQVILWGRPDRYEESTYQEINQANRVIALEELAK